MVWSLRRRVIVSCSVGWCLTILGIVMIPLVEYIVKKKVESTVVIKEGGQLYEYWVDPPVPIYLQIYMFNLTNHEEFLKGEKPSVSQTGPYTYRERRVKFNITWNDNGTVTYRQKRIFTFIPEMSKGKESDYYLIPNPVYWALFNGLKYEYPTLQKVISDLASVFDEHPFMFRTFKEAIWGYRDPMLNVTKAIDPEWFYTDIIGFFMNKNDTDDGVYTVYTGADDLNQLGIIDYYNGTKYLEFWSTPWANMINGSDGTLGPPYLPKDMLMHTFSSDICRSVAGVFASDVKTKQGINLWRFEAPSTYMQNATENPDNVGFCTPDKTHCLGAGVINGTMCQQVDFFNMPIAYSMPHFLFADKRYIDGVYGMHPVEKEHTTTIDLEPYTGLVLQAAKRLQISVYMAPIENVKDTLNITPVFYPVFWLNESVSIDDTNAKKFFSLLFTPLQIVHAVEITLIALGALVLMVTIIYSVWTVKRNRNITANFHNEQMSRDESDDTRPIISYDDDIIENQSTPDDSAKSQPPVNNVHQSTDGDSNNVTQSSHDDSAKSGQQTNTFNQTLQSDINN